MRRKKVDTEDVRIRGYYLGTATGKVYAQTGLHKEEWQKWSSSDEDWTPSTNPGTDILFLNEFAK